MTLPGWYIDTIAWLVLLCAGMGTLCLTCAILDRAVSKLLTYFEVWDVAARAICEHVRKKGRRESA